MPKASRYVRAGDEQDERDRAQQNQQGRTRIADTNRADSLSLHPINHDVKTYHELEQLLRDEGGGANLREAVKFFIVHHRHKRFTPKTVSECIKLFPAAFLVLV